MNQNRHLFLFTPGIWLGEGKISFRASPEHLKFYTKWEIEQEDQSIIRAVQTIQIEGNEESTRNSYTFYDRGPETFLVKLENELIGVTTGKGLYDGRIIAWEMGNTHSTSGFENYELQASGDYFHHAEYGGDDQLGTTIEGLLWKKFSR